MKKLSIGLVLGAGILWGSMGLFVRHFNTLGLFSLEVSSIRAIFAAIIMLFVLLIYDRKLLKIKLKDIWIFFGSGCLSVLFFNYCYFATIEKTSMSVAAVLLYTAPAIVMVFSAFLFKERITLRKVVAIVLTFAGCVFVSGILSGDAPLNFAGFMTGLGAGLGYALYSIFGRFAINRGYNTFTITFYTFFMASIGSLFISDVPKMYEVATKSVGNLLFSILYAIVCTILPYLLYTLGLKNIQNGIASVIASIEPVTATILGILVYSEVLTLPIFIGIVLVLGGIVICRKE